MSTTPIRLVPISRLVQLGQLVNIQFKSCPGFVKRPRLILNEATFKEKPQVESSVQKEAKQKSAGRKPSDALFFQP